MACGQNKLITSQSLSGPQVTLPAINGQCPLCKQPEEHGHLPGCIAARNPIIAISKKPKREFHEIRSSICAGCEYADGDTCTVVEAKHPGYSSIAHGVVRPGLKCPLPDPKWTEFPVMCPSCGRPKQKFSDRIGVCQWCEIEFQVAAKNKRQQNPHAGTFFGRRPFASLPFSEPIVRNLHYFMYPRQEASTRYHLDRLQRSIATFNGKRICCVATDENTIEKSITDELNELFTHVYYVPNDPNRREGAGFIQSLSMLETNDPNEVICFAHAKGQQRHTGQSRTIRMWSDAMYETVVENWEGAKVALERGYPVAGAFKSYGSFLSTRHKWHFSGSFWWGRSARLFENPHWRNTCNKWWQSESYVGRHWHESDGYCLFGDKIKPGSLYHEQTWTSRINKELEQWRSVSLIPTQ